MTARGPPPRRCSGPESLLLWLVSSAGTPRISPGSTRHHSTPGLHLHVTAELASREFAAASLSRLARTLPSLQGYFRNKLHRRIDTLIGEKLFSRLMKDPGRP